jgi:hypothetical protein
MATVHFTGRVLTPTGGTVSGVTVNIERDDSDTWVHAAEGTSGAGGAFIIENVPGITDPDVYRIRAEAAPGFGPSPWHTFTLADGQVQDITLVLGPPRQERQTPRSSWISKVSWVPDRGVQVQFHHKGVPYFECYYPQTTFQDYQQYVLAVSLGRWEHAFYYRRPYIAVPIGS